MEPIVVLGAGGHAKVVAQSLRRLKAFEVVGFIDEIDAARKGEAFAGAHVLGGREMLRSLLERGARSVAIAIGDNAARLQREAELLAMGFEFPAVVDPHAVVADDVLVGAGTYVAAGAVVQPGTRLGRQVIVNTGAVADHDCQVGDGVHLCPGSRLVGHVSVGRRAWIGAGAVVRDRVRVGDGAFVGIGALVLADVQSDAVVYGHPARPRKEAG